MRVGSIKCLRCFVAAVVTDNFQFNDLHGTVILTGFRTINPLLPHRAFDREIICSFRMYYDVRLFFFITKIRDTAVDGAKKIAARLTMVGPVGVSK